MWQVQVFVRGQWLNLTDGLSWDEAHEMLARCQYRLRRDKGFRCEPMFMKFTLP